MPLVVNYRPGYAFAAGELVTEAKLNLLGNPTILLEGTVSAAAIGDGTVGTSAMADGAVTTSKLADGAATPSKLDPATVGAGLTGGLIGAVGAPVNVNVDPATLEIASDVVRVKAGGIGLSQLASGLFAAATAKSAPALTDTVPLNDVGAAQTITAGNLTRAGSTASNTVTSLTRSGTTATAKAASHGYTAGQLVTISGASPSEFNGTFVVATVADLDTFTYTLARDPGMNAALTTITATGICTALATLATHGYATGQLVTMAGATAGAYNGQFAIVRTGANTFVYGMASDPGGSAATSTSLTAQGVLTKQASLQSIGAAVGGLVASAKFGVVLTTAITSANISTNQFYTATAHGLASGNVISLRTTGSFPTVAGTALAANTPYWVAVIDTTHFTLFYSRADYLASINGVDITNATFSGTFKLDYVPVLASLNADVIRTSASGINERGTYLLVYRTALATTCNLLAGAIKIATGNVTVDGNSTFTGGYAGMISEHKDNAASASQFKFVASYDVTNPWEFSQIQVMIYAGA